MLKGIDISEHQGKDFRIADHSPEFVIIRGGFSETVDRCAYGFLEQAEKLGIPWGIYWYSYALTIKDATAEAGACIKFLNGKIPTLGVWFDMEDADNFKQNHGFPTAETITLMCREFCGCMKARGLFSGIYASRSWFGTKILADELPRWVAAWGWNDGINYPNLTGEAVMHQYRGAPLDLDLIYNPSAFGLVELPEKSKSREIDIDEIAQQVLDGKWSNGLERKEKLGAWFYSVIQNRVNEIYKERCGKNGTL